MILEVMKPQIAAGSRGVPPAYGEVLFRAWRETPGEGEGAVSLEVRTISVLTYVVYFWL